MTWLTWPGSERHWRGHPRIVLDSETGRYRWRFLPPDHAFWKTADVLSWLSKDGSVKNAYRYLDESRTADTVFSVVHDLDAAAGSSFPSTADASAASQLVAAASAALAAGRNPGNMLRAEELVRCRAAALAALRKDPNCLRAQLLLAEQAHEIEDLRAAFSEWLDLYFRILSGVAALRRLAVSRVTAQRVLDGYASFHGIGELERLGQQLGVASVLEAQPWDAVGPLARSWAEMRRAVTSGDLLQHLRQSILPGVAGGGFLAPSAHDMRVLAEMAGRIPRFDAFHAELIRAVPMLAGLLRSHELRYRTAALAALVAIADPQCVRVLTDEERQSGETAWRAAVHKGLDDIQRTVAERGAAWPG